jgi:peptidoglycan lytic transglycosylase
LRYLYGFSTLRVLKNLWVVFLVIGILVAEPLAAAVIQGKLPLPRPRPLGLNGSIQTSTPVNIKRRPSIVLTSSRGSLSSSELTTLDRAIRYALNKDFASGFRESRGLSDPAARTLVEWLFVLSPALEAGQPRISEFIKKNPEWPRKSILRVRAEQSLFKNPPAPDVVLDYYRSRSPTSAEGKLALARAYVTLGNISKARRWARDAWRENKMDKNLERAAYKEFRKLLGHGDRMARVQLYIYARKFKAAQRNAVRLGRGYVKMVTAANTYVSKSTKSRRAYLAVPQNLRGDTSLLYARVRGLRLKKKIVEARRLIAKAPTSAGKRGDLKRWWIERRLLAREALAAGAVGEAYRLVSQHGFALNATSRRNYIDAEFMAGWIALRYLKKTSIALIHFKRLEKAANGPRSRSAATYWLSRTYKVRGNVLSAKKYLERAASRPQTYYGQLALDALGRSPTPILLGATPRSTSGRLKSYNSVRALIYLKKLGYKSLTNSFFNQLPYVLKQPGDLAALAALATSYGLPHVSLRIAKRSSTVYGYDFGRLQFPTNVLPRLKKIGRPVEMALVHALIRQESEFNGAARSYAGAQGLMQMMPGTAKITARRYAQPYSRKRLYDPSYNLMLGTAHIGDLIYRFSGSYIMLIAAYNAGGGRVNEWNKKFGDPRTGAIDPIDWVESIPFNETRNYVKRVMENVHVYRSALNGGSKTTMTSDLSRFKAVAKIPARARSRTSSSTSGCVSISVDSSDEVIC